ncbi:MAG TPA: 3-phosphoshikimate 1-carboxyvinyltransferase [Acidobacteriota bacterium]
MIATLKPARRVRGAARVPGDKSISHRAFLLAALADGAVEVRGAGRGEDVRSTLRCVAELGAAVSEPAGADCIRVQGRSLRGLSPPRAPLDCGNSGTTLRLLAGILAGHSFAATLTGDASLSARPMERVAAPLRAMGARVELSARGTAPLWVEGGALRGIDYSMPVASAQVKSCILLAALYAEGASAVREPVPTRDHTERLLGAAGVSLKRERGAIVITPATRLSLDRIEVPGDFSSAAFLLAAAALLPGSEIELRAVGLNPSRTAFLDLLHDMGAAVEHQIESESGAEPRGAVRVRGAELRAVSLGPERAAALIDELPLVAALAARAEGISELRGAAELRHKESDRLAAMAQGLRALGAQVEELPDGWVIQGPAALCGAELQSRGDHRVAMALAVLALAARGPSRIHAAECVAVSFPGFFETLESLVEC